MRVYHFVLYDSIDSQCFINFTNLLNAIDEKDIVHIYLNSNGGTHATLYGLLNIINDDPDRFKIVVSERIDSAAMDLVLMSNCEKQFLPSFKGGVLHLSYIETTTSELVDKSSESSQILSAIRRMNSYTFSKYAELGISEDKLSLAQSGQDVYLTANEIKKAVKYKEKEGIMFKK